MSALPPIPEHVLSWQIYNVRIVAQSICTLLTSFSAAAKATTVFRAASASSSPGSEHSIEWMEWHTRPRGPRGGVSEAACRYGVQITLSP
eukprot:COSAG06_NODE_239_length_19404_cov_12.723284_16_plen_90_part_00